MRALFFLSVILIFAAVPIAARQCYFCFSDHRALKDDCVKVVDSTRAIFCDSHIEDCVVYLRRDKIYGNLTGEIVRDCMVDYSLLVTGEHEVCSGDKCNYFNFPRDRLLCQQCENCEQIQREPELCRLYFKYHSACISYIEQLTNRVNRGCQMDPDDTFCDSGSNQCVYCMYNDCNRDPPRRQLSLNCYHCDDKDSDCYAVQDHTAQVKYNDTVLMGTVFYCWTIFAGVNNGVVFRFAALERDFNVYFDRYCGHMANTQCVRCFGNLCNTHYRNGVCYECLEDNPDCDNDGSLLMPIRCEKNHLENYGCYGVMINEGKQKLRRGCITDLDYLHQKSCLESKDCFFCRGEYCNKRAYQCYKCSQTIGNSTLDLGDDHDVVPEVDCLKGQKESWSMEFCGIGDSCFLHISTDPEDGSMLVERGCMSGNLLVHPMRELTSPGTFQLCRTSLCNKWDAISDSHSCYNLQGEVIKCEAKTNYCFTVHLVSTIGEQLFDKGCYNPSRKFNLKQHTCDVHIDTCKICAGDLCNDEQTKVNMTLQCLHCNDRRACLYYDPDRSLQKCVGEKYFWQPETCFYGLDPVSRNVTRGCTMVEYPGRNTPPSNLLYCPRDGCNFYSVNDYQCYQCDSNSPNAPPGYCFMVSGAKEEVLMTPSACLGSSIFQDKERGCYTYYTPTRILKRGCIRHLTAETIAFCETNQTHCKLCFEEECNNKNINTGGKLVGGIVVGVCFVGLFFILW